jgi:hypothetical protein
MTPDYLGGTPHKLCHFGPARHNPVGLTVLANFSLQISPCYLLVREGGVLYAGPLQDFHKPPVPVGLTL